MIEMDRFEIKTISVQPEHILDDLYLLNNILQVESKRTYFKKLEANEDFTININGTEFSSIEKVLTHNQMVSNDYIRVIHSSELRKDLSGTIFDDTWVRFIKSSNE